MEFELMGWGDGTVNLYHEDLGSGNDIRFVLNEDGTVERVTWEFTEAQPDGVEVRTPVADLVKELRRLALGEALNEAQPAEGSEGDA